MGERLQPLVPHPLAYDKSLCASLDGFTLHAASRAGALHPGGREALLRYVVRITLKKTYTDGTVVVDMDPLSLLCRLAWWKNRQTSPASWPRWASRSRCPTANRGAVPRTERAACSAARRSVTKTTVRAGSKSRERSTAAGS